MNGGAAIAAPPLRLPYSLAVPSAQRIGNLLGVSVPFAGLVAAIVLLWGRAVGAPDLAILAVGYVVSGIGVTVGFHRHFTHRSFQTTRPVRVVLAVLGSAAVEQVSC